MESVKICNFIFDNTEQGLYLSKLYGLTMQRDVGLDWVTRQAPLVGAYLAYLRVQVGKKDACLFFNAVINSFARQELGIASPHCDDDRIEIPVNKLLYRILEANPGAMVDMEATFYRHICKQSHVGDAKQLRDIDVLADLMGTV